MTTQQPYVEPSHECAMLPGEVLAEELASAFNQFEREARLKVECSISDLERRDAERELLFVRVVQELREKAGSLKDGRDGVDGKDGRDADVTEIRTDIITELRSIADRETSRVTEALATVRNGEPGLDGKDADAQEIAALLIPEVERAVAALPRPQDGKDADPEVVRAMVLDAVAAIPVPRDGKDADPELVKGMVAEELRNAVSGLPRPIDGKDGSDGRDGKDADIPYAPADIVEQITKALVFAQMPAMSTDIHLPPLGKPRQKTITMSKDRNGNAVAHVVEEPN
jgi:hypothetical protein